MRASLSRALSAKGATASNRSSSLHTLLTLPLDGWTEVHPIFILRSGAFCYDISMKSRKGNTSIIPLLMLSAAIVAFYQLSQSSLDNREKEIRRAERMMGFQQLEARLRGAFDDPFFVSEFFYKPNVAPPKDEESKKRIPVLRDVVAAFESDPENFKILYPSSKEMRDPKDFSVWIGGGARLSYPNFDLCTAERECPMEARIVDMNYESVPEGDLLVLTVGLHSTRPDITGPFNSKSEHNQFKVPIKTGLMGLVLKDTSLYCDKNYALLYMHADPLEVLCRPLN